MLIVIIITIFSSASVAIYHYNLALDTLVLDSGFATFCCLPGFHSRESEGAAECQGYVKSGILSGLLHKHGTYLGKKSPEFSWPSLEHLPVGIEESFRCKMRGKEGSGVIYH